MSRLPSKVKNVLSLLSFPRFFPLILTKTGASHHQGNYENRHMVGPASLVAKLAGIRSEIAILELALAEKLKEVGWFAVSFAVHTFVHGLFTQQRMINSRSSSPA